MAFAFAFALALAFPLTLALALALATLAVHVVSCIEHCEPSRVVCSTLVTPLPSAFLPWVHRKWCFTTLKTTTSNTWPSQAHANTALLSQPVLTFRLLTKRNRNEAKRIASEQLLIPNCTWYWRHRQKCSSLLL